MIKKRITANLLATSILLSNTHSISAISNNEISEDMPINTLSKNEESVLDTSLELNNSTESTETCEIENLTENSGISDSNEFIDIPEISEDNESNIDNNIDKDNSIVDDNNIIVIDSSKIKDINLLFAINSSLGKENLHSSITKKEALSIEELDLSNCGISSLDGIDKLSNLKYLNLSNNSIFDISPLSDLIKLEEIHASNNNISDINCLSKLKIIKGDFSNQIITLHQSDILDNSIKIENPLKYFFEDSYMSFVTSHNGIYKDGFFKWDNLSSGDYNLDIEFRSTYLNLDFSGTILKPISNKEFLSDIDIELDTNINFWTNSDIEVNYSITGNLIDSIEKIEIPNNKDSSVEFKGSFIVSENGLYTIKVFLNNGDVANKSIEIKNIDKEKPTIKVVKNHLKDNKININLEANDSLSGIDYILLPDGKKVYDNVIDFVGNTDTNYIFEVYDKAGNSESLEISSKNESIKKPIIVASNKSIYLGSSFNPLEGVSAKDFEGKDITDNIIIVENNVDTNSLGEYTVTYKVADSYSNESIKTIIVEVINKEYNSHKNNNKEEISSVIDENINTTDDNEKTGYNSSYFTAILLSMLSGIIFLFKSGKDDF